MDLALEVKNLTVQYGEHAVIRDLSLSVPRGDCLAVIGPNGSGKTVFFKALIGSIPSLGTVRWLPGTKIGYVPQKLDLERDLPITGTDFLRSKAAVLGVAPGEIPRALDWVSLDREVAAQPIGTLSGGQFQRLLLAFALLGAPTVLLFDEPTAGMDEPGQGKLYELIHRLRLDRGLTVLLISHELNLVYQYATNVLFLGGGQTCYGPPREVLTNPLLQDVYGAPLKVHLPHGLSH